MTPIESTIMWIHDYGGWAGLVLLLAAFCLLCISTTHEAVTQLEALKKSAEKEKEIIPTLYVRYNHASYRIKVIGKAVWCGRQYPIGDNCPIDLNGEHIPPLYVGGNWDLTTVMAVIAEYESLSQEGGQ